MTEKRKHINDFVARSNEKGLNRLLQVIENTESPILAYTHTGEPILKEDLCNLATPHVNVISQEDYDKRMAVLNAKSAVVEVSAQVIL